MDLNKLREQIDLIDDVLRELLRKRFELSKQVALIKAESNEDIYKPEREAEVLERACKDVPDDMQDYYRQFFIDIMNMSKDYQERIIKSEQK